MTTSFAQFDGPRLLGREERRASNELLRICFEDPDIGRREEELAVSALPPKRGGRYVLAHQGRLVSQIENFHNQIRMHDGILRVASIGGVCTHPDYRNQGLTSHLLETV